ncbi:MAG: hypothetical protein JKY53_05735, partial [Flavobacteriales bacterium]|nr:hypothetical protein [Flavobacteriales bacterium]
MSVNLTHTSAWPHECLPEKFYNRIAQENPNATINGNKLHRYSWGYMNLLQKQNLNHWQDRDYPSSIADYRIINLSDISVDSLYTTIDSDEQSQLVLQRKTIKSSFKPIRITKSEAITSRKNSYHKMLSLELDTISKNKSYLCEYSVDLSSDKFPFICWLVVDVKNFEGKAISYDYVKLHWNHLEPVHNLLDERNT